MTNPRDDMDDEFDFQPVRPSAARAFAVRYACAGKGKPPRMFSCII